MTVTSTGEQAQGIVHVFMYTIPSEKLGEFDPMVSNMEVIDVSCDENKCSYYVKDEPEEEYSSFGSMIGTNHLVGLVMQCPIRAATKLTCKGENLGQAFQFKYTCVASCTN